MKNILARSGIEFLSVLFGIIQFQYGDDNLDVLYGSPRFDENGVTYGTVTTLLQFDGKRLIENKED